MCRKLGPPLPALARVARGDLEVATLRTGSPVVWVVFFGVGFLYLFGSFFLAWPFSPLPGHNYPVSGALCWRFFGPN